MLGHFPIRVCRPQNSRDLDDGDHHGDHHGDGDGDHDSDHDGDHGYHHGRSGCSPDKKLVETKPSFDKSFQLFSPSLVSSLP